MPRGSRIGAVRHRDRADSGAFATSASVASAVVDGAAPMAAWREHLRLTQAKVAARMGVPQAAYAQMEAVKRPRKATLTKLPRRWGWILSN